MARRSGFFVQMQRNMARAAREAQRAQAAAEREALRQQKAYERALQAEERLTRRMEQMAASERRVAERELRRLHLEAREAQVDAMNADLRNRQDEIDNLLLATLAVDDYVDLARLKVTAEHPRFSSSHEVPFPQPEREVPPPPPQFVAPEQPTGLSRLLGGSRRYQEEYEARRADYLAIAAEWQRYVDGIPGRDHARFQEWQQAEGARLTALAADRARYAHECALREAAAADENRRLDELTAALDSGRADAVEEYLAIVFGNSVYPDDLVSVEEFSYEPIHRELTIVLRLPDPEALPAEAAFKYQKASDQIVSVALPVKDRKARYVRLVMSAALRTVHEVWESDRRGHVDTISLTGVAHYTDRAVGRDGRATLIAIATDRMTFSAIDLARVAPDETLRHLGGRVSRDPYGCVPIDVSSAVRKV